MENKKEKSASQSTKKGYPTLLGTLFFTTFNLIFLSIIAWIFLVGWFSVKNVLFHHEIIPSEINTILTTTLQIILNRAHVFIVSIPFMCVILFVLVVDGLAQRDIRKFQVARESTFLFHRLKPLAGFVFFVLFFVYMAIPLTVPPTMFLALMVVLSGLFTTFAIKSFKKYM